MRLCFKANFLAQCSHLKCRIMTLLGWCIKVITQGMYSETMLCHNVRTGNAALSSTMLVHQSDYAGYVQ